MNKKLLKIETAKNIYIRVPFDNVFLSDEVGNRITAIIDLF